MHPPPSCLPTETVWVHQAIARIEADVQRSADTHLIQLDLPGWTAAGIDMYLKDESTHPTGSLKHRLARSLFLYALCNGLLHEGQTVIEASSGSTAISEAYFARLLGLPFVAVMTASTSPEKIALIQAQGGQCHLVQNASEVYQAARDLAAQCNGHYMDQFTHAERATDWRGNNNIAQSIFAQMAHERHPVPTWLVVAAGTGGTSATLGRFVRYRRLPSRLCVPDPEGSVFAEHHRTGQRDLQGPGSRIEGIGRPRVEESYVRGVIDHSLCVPDVHSLGAMRALSQRLDRPVGPSTGTHLAAMLTLAQHMHDQGDRGSIVSLLCDSGWRYQSTYHNANWVQQHFGSETLTQTQRFKDWLDGPAKPPLTRN